MLTVNRIIRVFAWFSVILGLSNLFYPGAELFGSILFGSGMITFTILQIGEEIIRVLNKKEN